MLLDRLIRAFRPPRGAPMLPVPGGRVLASGRRRRVGGFLLDVRPVCNAEYRTFMKATGAPAPPWIARPGFDDPEQPVVGVSWSEATAYARWARKRLPTDLEWLRAARGDDGRPYPWGDAAPHAGHAWFQQGERGAPGPDDPGRSRGAAPFGHRDMLGNVWEWCDGAVALGGFWGSDELSLEARLAEPPDRRSAGIGFRCAR